MKIFRYLVAASIVGLLILAGYVFQNKKLQKKQKSLSIQKPFIKTMYCQVAIKQP